MLREVVRRGELRPGVPLLREVPDVEAEVQRLSEQGWMAVFWPQPPSASHAVDLLLLAVGKAAQRHAVEHEPRWTPDAWSRAAKLLLSEGQIPIPGTFGRELTLRRLIRWLAPDARDLVMGVAGPVAELRAIETRGANLTRANLSHTDLRGADLSQADLSGANLNRTNLTGASLRGPSSWRPRSTGPFSPMPT